MGIATPELGPESFRLARQAERAAACDQRRRARAEALSRLHHARDAFRDHVAEGGLGGDADDDSDTLEALADRLLDWVQTLEREFDRMQPARDQTRRAGAVLTRLRAPSDPAGLALILAETLGEAVLSDPAAAVLVAAVRRASA
jgi:hypothetical protein